jgi:acyl-CoA thioester hydrolase
MQPLLTYRGTVYAWHCDHLGHMNNMWYAGKFDEAGWYLLSQMGMTPTYLREANCGLATVEQVCTFKRELLAGDSIEVHSRVLEVRERVVKIAHEMRNTETGELCATLQITAVHMDLCKRRATAIPDLQRRMAQDLVMEPLERAA